MSEVRERRFGCHTDAAVLRCTTARLFLEHGGPVSEGWRFPTLGF